MITTSQKQWRTIFDGRTVVHGSPEDMQRDPKPEDVTLVLRHFRDMPIKPEYGRLENTVFYGGNGACDPKAPEDSHFAIQRKIESAKEALRQDEGRELLAFVRGSSRRVADFPEAIRPPESMGLFCALSHLCEGYLLTNVVFESFEYDASIKKAIRLSGAEHLNECDVKALRNESQSAWFKDAANWTDVLGASLQRGLRERLGNTGECIRSFLERLETNKSQPLSPIEVAEVYNQLTDKLVAE
ncbi:MAG: hypothetical protein AAF483_15075 [Planctomycetota bacterium]